MYRFCCMKVFFFLYGFLILLKKTNIWAIKLLSINAGFELYLIFTERDINSRIYLSPHFLGID